VGEVCETFSALYNGVECVLKIIIPITFLLTLIVIDYGLYMIRQVMLLVLVSYVIMILRKKRLPVIAVIVAIVTYTFFFLL
jgi:hypothetical protein